MKQRSKKLLGILLSLALMLSLVPGMSLTAYAATIDSSSTTWSEDSIIADDEVMIEGKVTVTNNITLTIPKDKVLTVYGGIDIGSNTLTIAGYGWLYVYGQGGNNGNNGDEGNDRDGGDGGCGIKGNIIINGAKVSVEGGTGGSGGIGYDEEDPAGKGGKGHFNPTGDITREQLAAILYRYEQSKGGGFTGMWMFLLDYPDAAEISEWADEAMHWCVMNGIINGKDGKLVPGGNATRAEAATMLMRYCSKIAE